MISQPHQNNLLENLLNSLSEHSICILVSKETWVLYVGTKIIWWTRFIIVHFTNQLQAHHFVELALAECWCDSCLCISGGKQNSQNQPEKPFHCNVCDGTFSRYSSLWSHKRLHSGDKPFKCEVCGLAFAKGKDQIIYYNLYILL